METVVIIYIVFRSAHELEYSWHEHTHAEEQYQCQASEHVKSADKY